MAIKRKPSAKKRIWELYSETHLRLWPMGDKVSFFSDTRSGRSMPQKLIGSEGDIRAPKPLPVDLLAKRGILQAGFAEHYAGYYHSRVNDNFIDLAFVISGEMEVKYENVRRKMNDCEVLAIPPNRLCDTFVNLGHCRVAWLHFKKDSEWSDIFGSEIFLKTLSNAPEIISVMNLYMEEVFSKNRSLKMLEILADALEFSMKREFSPNRSSARKGDFSELLNQIKSSLDKPWTSAATAKRLGLNIKTLNAKFSKEHSMNFSKYLNKLRMQKALELLKNGADNTALARKLGYADASTFAKSFKAYYGTPPKRYKSESFA